MKIQIAVSTSAVDAYILSKDKAVEIVAKEFGVSIDEVATIGDGTNDLPMLTMPGLGLAGAPSNALDQVKEVIQGLDNGFISEFSHYDGFRDFYQRAADQGIKLIVSDRDGVLKGGGDMQWGEEFRELALEMGGDNPFVMILTGSTIHQNLPFMKEYGLDERLAANPYVQENPYLVMMENGALKMNVLNGELRDYIAELDVNLLAALRLTFMPIVKERLEEEVFSDFGLEWSKDSEDKSQRINHVEEKLSMVTFDMPRTFLDGKPYRDSESADRLRERMVGIMVEVAEELELPYELT